MSPSVRARIAQSDAEFDRQSAREEQTRRVAAEVAYERAVMLAAQEKAAEEGLPLHQAMREVGHEKHEFVAIISARQDLEDAQRRARQRQALRRAGTDSDSGEPIEVLQPSDLAIEAAAVLAPRSATAEQVGRGVRGKWLRRAYRRME